MDEITKDQLNQLIQDKDDREPAIRPGVITGFVGALLGLLTAFGLDLSAEQTLAISTVILFGAPIFATIWARRKTWSPNSVFKLVEEALRNEPLPTVETWKRTH